MSKITLLYSSISILLCMQYSLLFAASRPKVPRVTANQSAPAFSVTDVNGNNFTLGSKQGRKVLLLFFRSAGCPICNLHMHELLQNADYFKTKNLEVVAIYESSRETMVKYLEDTPIPFTLIPNPQKNLYGQYAVGTSFGKGLGSFFFHGATSKAKKGQKLYKKKIKQDGNMNQLTADFLIDEKGKIVNAHYGEYLGDHISVESIKKFIN